MPDTITINLGTGDNGETDIPSASATTDKIKFKNITAVEITLTTPQGMNPRGDTDIAAGETETQNGFTISSNAAATYDYSWENKDSKARATRTGTIRVT